MLPLDQTSPVTFVVEVPVNVNDAPEPLQVPGLRVWMAAPLVPALRATAVAVALTLMVGPAPSTCIIATGIVPVPVTAKVTPAIDLSVT
jgi:hypothetical protein